MSVIIFDRGFFDNVVAYNFIERKYLHFLDRFKHSGSSQSREKP